MKILLLNGPPRCGKDTFAKVIKGFSPSLVHIEKFALPMKLCVPIAYGITQERWAELDSAELKDKPADELFGRTPREPQIGFSEDFLKKMHGKDIFGRLLLRRLEHVSAKFETVAISDSGFREEAEMLVKHYGAENVYLWRIYREGCDYKDDGRGYIDLEDLGVLQFDIENTVLDDEGDSLKKLKGFVARLYMAFNTPQENIKEDKTRDPELEGIGAYRERIEELMQKEIDRGIGTS